MKNTLLIILLLIFIAGCSAQMPEKPVEQEENMLEEEKIPVEEEPVTQKSDPSLEEMKEEETQPAEEVEEKKEEPVVEEIPEPLEENITIPKEEPIEIMEEKLSTEQVAELCNSLCENDSDLFCEEYRIITVREREVNGTCRAFSRKYNVRGFDRCERFCKSYDKSGTFCYVDGRKDIDCNGKV